MKHHPRAVDVRHATHDSHRRTVRVVDPHRQAVLAQDGGERRAPVPPNGIAEQPKPLLYVGPRAHLCEVPGNRIRREDARAYGMFAFAHR